MFYDAVENKHGLRHDPLKALLVPRPIGWISTLSREGVVNLAPYSFFNGVAERPAYVVFGSDGIKDSLRNIIDTGEFVCSLATWDLRHAMNTSSAPVPHNVDEFPLAGLTHAPSQLVAPPRVAESPAALECKLHQVIELPGKTAGTIHNYRVVIGLVAGIYIDDRYIKDGIVDTGAMRPIARLGYMEYAVVTPQTMFAFNRPTAEEALGGKKGS